MTTSSPGWGTAPVLQSAAVLHWPPVEALQLTVLRKSRLSSASARHPVHGDLRLLRILLSSSKTEFYHPTSGIHTKKCGVISAKHGDRI